MIVLNFVPIAIYDSGMPELGSYVVILYFIHRRIFLWLSYFLLQLLVWDQPSAFMLTSSDVVVLYNVWPLNPTINLLTLSVLSSEVPLWCHYHHQPSKGFGQRYHPSLWPKQLQIAQVLTFHPMSPSLFQDYYWFTSSCRLPVPRPGQVLGLVGINGIGKSTALNILAGAIKPNLGRFNVISYLPSLSCISCTNMSI